MAPLIPQSDQFHVQQQAFPMSSMFETDLNSMSPQHTLTQIPSNSSILPPPVSNIQSYSQPFRQPPSYSSQPQLPPALAFQTPFTAHPYFNKSLQLQGFQTPFNKDNSNSYQQSPEIPPPASTLDQEELLQICLRHFHLFKESRIPVLLPDTSFFSVVSQYIPLHEPLANAVASLAARNLSQLEGSYVQTAVDFKIKALNFLRHDLESRGVSKYSIVCMLILANIELNEGSIESWAQHLDGAAKGVAEILANNRVFETPENYKDFLVLLDALAYHDIMSCLSQCIRPRLHDVYARPWRNLKLKTSDYYYGMRQNMVNLSDIICLVADIYETSTNSPYTRYPASENGISKPPSSRYYCVSRSYYTPRQLQTYNQLLKNISDLDPTADVPSDVTKLAVCGKFGILLYFILKLDTDEFMHKLSSRIRDIKTQGLRSLSSLPLLYSTATIQAFLTWLIGIVCEIQSERAIVMNRIQELYKNVPRMSLYSVMNFLTIFWKYRDSPAYDNYTYRNLLMLVTDQTGFQIMV